MKLLQQSYGVRRQAKRDSALSQQGKSGVALRLPPHSIAFIGRRHDFKRRQPHNDRGKSPRFGTRNYGVSLRRLLQSANSPWLEKVDLVLFWVIARGCLSLCIF